MNTMKLSGVTRANGGTYENVEIEGVATVNGDIVCKEMHIEGVSTFEGNIDCSELYVEGTCKVSGAIKSTVCKLAGLLNVGQDLEAETFSGTGSFQIGGTLNAEIVDVRFVYGSNVREICGQDITIYKENTHAAAEFLMDLIPWRHKGKSFQSSLIEGDSVDIEYVNSGVVRGKRLIIGPECQIELVEYHESIDIHPSAKVKSIVKLET